MTISPHSKREDAAVTSDDNTSTTTGTRETAPHASYVTSLLPIGPGTYTYSTSNDGARVADGLCVGSFRACQQCGCTICPKFVTALDSHALCQNSHCLQHFSPHARCFDCRVKNGDLVHCQRCAAYHYRHTQFDPPNAPPLAWITKAQQKIEECATKQSSRLAETDNEEGKEAEEQTRKSKKDQKNGAFVWTTQTSAFGNAWDAIKLWKTMTDKYATSWHCLECNVLLVQPHALSSGPILSDDMSPALIANRTTRAIGCSYPYCHMAVYRASYCARHSSQKYHEKWLSGVGSSAFALFPNIIKCSICCCSSTPSDVASSSSFLSSSSTSSSLSLSAHTLSCSLSVRGLICRTHADRCLTCNAWFCAAIHRESRGVLTELCNPHGLIYWPSLWKNHPLIYCLSCFQKTHLPCHDFFFCSPLVSTVFAGYVGHCDVYAF